uniref:Uncharacterized protein n=1 Tax=Rhizophora mucronata TaxID=61149 RepID=A0A2P2R0P3_RHIMU
MITLPQPDRILNSSSSLPLHEIRNNSSYPIIATWYALWKSKST